MADDIDALKILITAEDDYSVHLKTMDEETRSFVDNTEEYLAGAKTFADEMTKSYLDDLETIQDIEKAKETASESELVGLQKIQDEYKRSAQVKKDAADKAIESIREEEEALTELIESHKAGTLEFIKDEKKRQDSQSESLWNVRRGGRGAAQAYNSVKGVLGGIGIQLGNVTKKTKQMGAANAETFNDMRNDGDAIMGVLEGIAGIDYGATISGLTSVAEQMEMMKKLSAQGKGISSMMKLNLALTGLQAIEPLVKGIVNYFRDAEGMAKLSAAVSAQTKATTQQAIDLDATRIKNMKEMVAVMGDTEDARALEKEQDDRTSQRLRSLDERIKKLNKTQEDYYIGKSLFQAEAIKNDTEQLESLKEQQAALLKLSSENKVQEEHAKRMKDLNTAKGYRDQTKALEENLVFLRQQNRENLTDYEIQVRRTRAKMIADGQSVEQVDAYNKLLDEQKELNESIAEQQAKRDGATKDEKTPFDVLMDEREAHFKKHEQFMDRYEDQLKKQFMTAKELRKEELERLNINPRMIKGILAQEEAMRKLKEAGPDPETDVEAGNVSRLSAGKSTDKMNEKERKTAEHRKKMEDLAKKQLDALKFERKNTIEFKEYKGT